MRRNGLIESQPLILRPDGRSGRFPVGGDVQGAVIEVPGLVAVGAGPFLQVLPSSSGALLFTYREPPGPDTGNGQGQQHFFGPPTTISASKLIIGNEDGYFRSFGP